MADLLRFRTPGAVFLFLYHCSQIYGAIEGTDTEQVRSVWGTGGPGCARQATFQWLSVDSLADSRWGVSGLAGDFCSERYGLKITAAAAETRDIRRQAEQFAAF